MCILRFISSSITKEPLNKSSAAVSGSFSPTLRYRKREIHTVFRRFRYLDWTKNLALTALADLFRGSLDIPCYNSVESNLPSEKEQPMSKGKFSNPRPYREEEREIEKSFRQLTGQEKPCFPEKTARFPMRNWTFHWTRRRTPRSAALRPSLIRLFPLWTTTRSP